MKVKITPHGAINICHFPHVAELHVYTGTVQTYSKHQKVRNLTMKGDNMNILNAAK